MKEKLVKINEATGPNTLAEWEARYPLFLEMAKHDEPEGATCFFCGKENDFADDIGWFYIYPDKLGPGGPCCKACWDGAPGRKHIELYGLGER
jgi:hypothetical protein